MKTVLLRSSSITAHSPAVPSSPRVCLSRHDSLTSIFSGDRAAPTAPKISLHLERNRRRGVEARGIQRAMSESDVIASQTRLPSAGSLSFPAKIPEEVFSSEAETEESGSLSLERIFADISNGGILVDDDVEELYGGGFGNGGKSGGDGGYRAGGGGFGGNSKSMGDYYLEMLTSNPGDPLLLRNYAKYLHEVQKDLVRAEEYYGRAILANPGDGEVLSLYGKLIWETQRDGERARSYFDQAVLASPDDCVVLGSYAHFMWEAEEDEEEGDIAELSPAAERFARSV